MESLNLEDQVPHICASNATFKQINPNYCSHPEHEGFIPSKGPFDLICLNSENIKVVNSIFAVFDNLYQKDYSLSRVEEIKNEITLLNINNQKEAERINEYFKESSKLVTIYNFHCKINELLNIEGFWNKLVPKKEEDKEKIISIAKQWLVHSKYGHFFSPSLLQALELLDRIENYVQKALRELTSREQENKILSPISKNVLNPYVKISGDYLPLTFSILSTFSPVMAFGLAGDRLLKSIDNAITSYEVCLDFASKYRKILNSLMIQVKVEQQKIVQSIIERLKIAYEMENLSYDNILVPTIQKIGELTTHCFFPAESKSFSSLKIEEILSFCCLKKEVVFNELHRQVLLHGKEQEKNLKDLKFFKWCYNQKSLNEIQSQNIPSIPIKVVLDLKQNLIVIPLYIETSLVPLVKITDFSTSFRGPSIYQVVKYNYACKKLSLLLQFQNLQFSKDISEMIVFKPEFDSEEFVKAFENIVSFVIEQGVSSTKKPQSKESDLQKEWNKVLALESNKLIKLSIRLSTYILKCLEQNTKLENLNPLFAKISSSILQSLIKVTSQNFFQEALRIKMKEISLGLFNIFINFLQSSQPLDKTSLLSILNYFKSCFINDKNYNKQFVAATIIADLTLGNSYPDSILKLENALKTLLSYFNEKTFSFPLFSVESIMHILMLTLIETTENAESQSFHLIQAYNKQKNDSHLERIWISKQKHKCSEKLKQLERFLKNSAIYLDLNQLAKHTESIVSFSHLDPNFLTLLKFYIRNYLDIYQGEDWNVLPLLLAMKDTTLLKEYGQKRLKFFFNNQHLIFLSENTKNSNSIFEFCPELKLEILNYLDNEILQCFSSIKNKCSEQIVLNVYEPLKEIKDLESYLEGLQKYNISYEKYLFQLDGIFYDLFFLNDKSLKNAIQQLQVWFPHFPQTAEYKAKISEILKKYSNQDLSEEGVLLTEHFKFRFPEISQAYRVKWIITLLSPPRIRLKQERISEYQEFKPVSSNEVIQFFGRNNLVLLLEKILEYLLKGEWDVSLLLLLSRIIPNNYDDDPDQRIITKLKEIGENLYQILQLIGQIQTIIKTIEEKKDGEELVKELIHSLFVSNVVQSATNYFLQSLIEWSQEQLYAEKELKEIKQLGVLKLQTYYENVKSNMEHLQYLYNFQKEITHFYRIFLKDMDWGSANWDSNLNWLKNLDSMEKIEYLLKGFKGKYKRVFLEHLRLCYIRHLNIPEKKALRALINLLKNTFHENEKNLLINMVKVFTPRKKKNDSWQKNLLTLYRIPQFFEEPEKIFLSATLGEVYLTEDYDWDYLKAVSNTNHYFPIEISMEKKQKVAELQFFPKELWKPMFDHSLRSALFESSGFHHDLIFSSYGRGDWGKNCLIHIVEPVKGIPLQKLGEQRNQKLDPKSFTREFLYYLILPFELTNLKGQEIDGVFHLFPCPLIGENNRTLLCFDEILRSLESETVSIFLKQSAKAILEELCLDLELHSEQLEWILGKPILFPKHLIKFLHRRIMEIQDILRHHPSQKAIDLLKKCQFPGVKQIEMVLKKSLSPLDRQKELKDIALTKVSPLPLEEVDSKHALDILS